MGLHGFKCDDFVNYELIYYCISFTRTAELGDFSINEHGQRYLSGLELLREQNEEAERRIMELHKLHRGQLPADAEYNYLEHAKKLYMYGVDIHKATVSGSIDNEMI